MSEQDTPTLRALVEQLQAHAKEYGWQDTDEPIAALLAWRPALAAAEAPAADQVRASLVAEVRREIREKCERSGYAFEHDLLCLLYTSDAADERSSVDLGGR